MDLDLFLFDFAGTTVRDDGIVLEAYRRVLGRAGLEADDPWLLARMGRTKRTVFEELLDLNGRPVADAPALAAGFDDAMAGVFEDRPPEALPGAEEAIAGLRAAGVAVGFTTGFSSATMAIILDRLGWRSDAAVASDEVASGRPAPDLIIEAMRRAGVSDAGRVGTCGDTPSDLLAGANAGCSVIVGVGHGTHSLDELARYPHTHLLPDLTGLVAALG